MFISLFFRVSAKLYYLKTNLFVLIKNNVSKIVPKVKTAPVINGDS
jgi:hypothetical protein